MWLQTLFLSPPILVWLVSGMDLVRVSNFKLGPQLLDDGLSLRMLDGFLCNLNCWDLPLHDHRGVHHVVGELHLSYLCSFLHLLDGGHLSLHDDWHIHGFVDEL